MLNSKEADFILRGDGEVIYPEISKDGLEIYYDVKGKKNSDLHKDKLLDMSGQGKDGELSGFDYEGELSGYDGDNGLVFDGIEDTLVRADVEDIEVVSATKNLISSKRLTKGDNLGLRPDTQQHIEIKLDAGVYTLSKDPDIYFQYWFKNPDAKVNVAGERSEVTFTAETDGVYYLVIQHATWSSPNDYKLQIEEGSTATPYVPYIPTAKMTYQLNNNVISYGEGGTVKWVKDGKVMERKGINLIRNGNFFYGRKAWNPAQATISHNSNGITFLASSNIGILEQRMDGKEGSLLLLRAEVKATSSSVGIGIGGNLYKSHSGSGKFEVIEYIRPFPSHEYLHASVVDKRNENWDDLYIKNYQAINLTATFGAGNEPTLEEIKAEPDKWQWTPNPMDLLEARELGGNILGDMEDIVDASPRDRQSGKEVFTEHADDSHVEVEVDGQSYQHAGSGKNLFVPVRLKTNHSIKENSKLINTIGSQIFYPIESPIGVYTASFSYQHNLNYAPIFMTFYYSDGSSDGNSHGYLDSTIQIRKEMTSNSAKKVVGVGYNAPTVIGVEWGTNPDPNMTRYGLALDTGVKTIGVSWDMKSNPSMIRSGGLV